MKTSTFDYDLFGRFDVPVQTQSSDQAHRLVRILELKKFQTAMAKIRAAYPMCDLPVEKVKGHFFKTHCSGYFDLLFEGGLKLRVDYTTNLSMTNYTFFRFRFTFDVTVPRKWWR
jgi:hypothetical protein